MCSLWEQYLFEGGEPKCRLSGENYERFLKSIQTMGGINPAQFLQGLTAAEFSLLYTADEYTLKNSGSSISVAEAANNLMVSVPAVSRTLKSLQQKQYIERRTDEKDKRSIRIVVTEKGRSVLKENVCGYFGIIDRILNRFTDEELTMMVELHCKFARELSEESAKQKKRS